MMLDQAEASAVLAAIRAISPVLGRLHIFIGVLCIYESAAGQILIISTTERTRKEVYPSQVAFAEAYGRSTEGLLPF